ncbi:MAG: prepilin-type N-terminal cleavage/methylation domain-containing protein [Armatimonadota bacterium]
MRSRAHHTPSLRGGDPCRFVPRGFSLVEMLVVVAIILVLAAMLLPVLEVALGKAESTSCLSNLRHLGMAVRLYCDDYDDRLVPALLPHPTAQAVCWDVTLQPYLRNRLILLCPTDESPRQAPGCICEPHSYGINLALAQVGGYLGSSLQLGDIEDPCATILFCELNGTRFATHGVDYDAGGLERVAVRRHGSGANYGFVDGHAKWLLPQRTEEPENLWRP